MHRDRITLIVLSLTFAVGAAVSCTSSEPVTMTGTAGKTGGTAGAGNTSGAAGSTSGAAGAGNTSGGTAGSNSGTAGAGNTGGSTSAGTAGNTTAGTAGSTAGSAGAGGSTAGSAGAGGSTADAGAAGTSGAMLSFATDIYTPIIAMKCMPCHTKASGQDGGPLDMSSAMAAYTSLVGTATPPTGALAKTDMNCKLLDSKKLRVEPGDPMHSYIYIKITNSDATLMGMNCGPAMPETSSHLTLTADQKQKVSDWITQGAKM
jgi:hypothetical protein